MSIETILILVVSAAVMLWAVKTGYIKALLEGYFFSFAVGKDEDGAKVPVVKLERGWWFGRKFVAASPISGNTPSMYGISKEHICNFLLTNREGYGQRIASLMEVVQQQKQKMLYDAAAQDAYRQACERVQDELKKVYRRVAFLASGAAEGIGGAIALRDVREHRAEFDNPLTLSSAMRLGMAAQDLGLLSRSAYENFLDSCEGMDKENIVYLDEGVRQEIMKYVDDPKQEKKLRRRQKWARASVWVYPLDYWWSWGNSLNLKG